MHGMAQKVAAALMAATLVLGGLVGCSLLPPRSAQDVLMRYARIDDRGNFVAEGNVDVVFSVFKTEVPLSIDITAQVMGEALHTVMSTKVFGTTMSSQSYMQKSGEDYVVYSSAGEDNDVAWTKSTLGGKKKDAKDEQGNTSDAEGEAANPIETVLLAQKVLEASEFEASDFAISGYGSVESSAVTVPADVEERAVDLDALSDDVSNLFNFENLGALGSQEAA